MPPAAGHAREQQHDAGEPDERHAADDSIELVELKCIERRSARLEPVLSEPLILRQAQDERRIEGPRIRWADGTGNRVIRDLWLRPQQSRCRGRRREHRGQTRTRNQIAHVRRSRFGDAQRGGDDERDRGSLPEEVNQGPADDLHRTIHREPPRSRRPARGATSSPLSSSRRISASSSGDALPAASACRTSLAADPSKTRSSRSVTRCRCV